MGATRVRLAELDVHDPAGRGPAGAVLVLHGAPAAVPVLPPDPLEVIHLEHEERDDPDENLGPRHVVQRIGGPAARAMGRVAQPRCPPVLKKRGGAGTEVPAPPAKRAT